MGCLSQESEGLDEERPRLLISLFHGLSLSLPAERCPAFPGARPLPRTERRPADGATALRGVYLRPRTKHTCGL